MPHDGPTITTPQQQLQQAIACLEHGDYAAASALAYSASLTLASIAVGKAEEAHDRFQKLIDIQRN